MVTENVTAHCVLYNCCQVMINNILPNKVKSFYFEKHEHLVPGETVTEDVNWKHSHLTTAFHDTLQNF